MTLAPFLVPSGCPKCRGMEFGGTYVPEHTEESWPPGDTYAVLEHVRWTCKRCGYQCVTKAADAP